MELAFLIAISLLLALIVLGFMGQLAQLYAAANLRSLPGPRPNWLFGNALQLSPEPDELHTQILGFANQYRNQGMFCLWCGAHPVVVLFKPELVEDLLRSSRYTKKSQEYDFLRPWIGTGLLTSNGAKWKARRRLITPAFHFQVLNHFIKVFEEQAVIMISHLEKRVNKGVFNIMPCISRCALDIICVTSMGSSPNVQENADSPYVNAVVRMSDLVQKRQKSPWLWNDVVYNLTPSGREHSKCLDILHDFTHMVIDERIAQREAKKSKPQESEEDHENVEENAFTRKKRLAFLDLLLEAYGNGEISREGVQEEVDTFMFEGHDTTAAAITWALYLLARHPEVQRKADEEVDNFFAHHPETLTVGDLKEFRYLDCVIKEAQRLFPSVPVLGRTVTEDYNFNGYTAPKGTTVVTAIVALHRNPEVWPAPLQFDPDRFLPENSQGRHPFAFIPFSAGPRNCIGQRFALLEVKIVLSYILHNFVIDSTQTIDELHTCSEIVTRPKEGIFVTLAKR
ncbi:cytochrome P450 4V2-like isoform X1 [Acropora millepora]|uniref:cytochrome P450 4V2-like isoform X1 n=2 Tax=Acropora millepora TaxID=45264 RepID=UPI001CF56E74|nr:cytochrome P450 4V2-like isoform X1 [Acropora millepora]